MMALLEGAGIDPTGQRGYHILWHVAQAGLICLGPMDGKHQTFVLLDEWVPASASRRLSREDATAELAGRYFTSHGPATLPDFAGWARLPMAAATAGLAAASSTLAPERIGTKDYWMGTETARCDVRDARGVHLLPGFDEYVLGYKDRGDILAPEHAARIVPGKNGVFLPTIVVGGRIVGTWKRTLRRGALDVTLHPFARLDAAEEGVAEAARRYGDCIGLSVASIAVEDTR